MAYEEQPAPADGLDRDRAERGWPLVEGRWDVRIRVPDAHAQSAAVDAAQAECRWAGRVPVGVGDQLASYVRKYYLVSAGRGGSPAWTWKGPDPSGAESRGPGLAFLTSVYVVCDSISGSVMVALKYWNADNS